MISLGWLCNKCLSSFIRHILRGETKTVSARSANKLCSTLWPYGWCLPGSSVHENLQARILEWVAIVFSKPSYQPRDWNCFSFRQILYHWATWEAKKSNRDTCKRFLDGTFLVVHWLRLHAANAGGTALITAQGNSRAWQPTPVFLPGESHRQRSLAGYSPWDHKESNRTEVT